MSTISLRIHPAIGMARVGNSEEYYLAPETRAGMPQTGATLTGGLPIKPGTETTTITSNDLRDSEGRLKRQASRFHIYQYDSSKTITYPSGDGSEVVIGSEVDGKKVIDIIWTVHLANKKANCWEIDETANTGIQLYEKGGFPPIRNPDFPPSSDPADNNRLKKLVIDAGPRVISSDTQQVDFDNSTTATFWDAEQQKVLPADYPISFPASDGGANSYNNTSEAITTLGSLRMESNGRLLVLGGFGKACGFDNAGNADSKAILDADVDNNNWLDDTADGPVTATLKFSDGSFETLENSAWVVSTDPAYAPQTLNVVSLWDDVYTTWLEQLKLNPAIYQNGAYQKNFKPYFSEEVFPALRAASLQMWNSNLPEKAIKSHINFDQLTEQKPSIDILSFLRNPNDNDDSPAAVGSILMPLSLGDAAMSFLSLSTSQYFFMQQWSAGLCEGAKLLSLGPGEALDKTVLFNCLGGRFSPGIDLTFIVRDINLYNQDWTNPQVGPFRINKAAMNYNQATPSKPFLGVGYTPLRNYPVEPGDLCKFMAIPWHTDYNSCATHTPAPNPGGDVTESNVFSGDVNTSLFWSWPAQRPVAVYTFEDLVANNGALPTQRYSVRGEGTAAIQQEGDGFNLPAMNVGRYQQRRDMLDNWQNIGTVIQGPAIEGYKKEYNPDYYLEVASNFLKDDSNLVEPWPNQVTDKTYKPKN